MSETFTKEQLLEEAQKFQDGIGTGGHSCAEWDLKTDDMLRFAASLADERVKAQELLSHLDTPCGMLLDRVRYAVTEVQRSLLDAPRPETPVGEPVLALAKQWAREAAHMKQEHRGDNVMFAIAEQKEECALELQRSFVPVGTQRKCKRCDGSGTTLHADDADGMDLETCSFCQGKGMVDAPSRPETTRACPDCGGTTWNNPSLKKLQCIDPTCQWTQPAVLPPAEPVKTCETCRFRQGDICGKVSISGHSVAVVACASLGNTCGAHTPRPTEDR